MVQGTKVEGMPTITLPPQKLIYVQKVHRKAEQGCFELPRALAAELIKAHDANETVSLNELRARG